jgi:hypothetical protein
MIPLLLLFGATASRSYVQIDPDTLTARFGWYRLVIPRSRIESANEDRWPWYGGLGWRTNFRSVLGLIGAYSPVVKINLTEPARSRLLGIPIRITDIYVSVESPSTLRAALSL